MRLTRWDYICGRCGHAYALPGADLSFAYGTFLGVSPSGETATLDSLGDSVVDDVSVRVGLDERVGGLSERERRDLVFDVMSAVCDPDAQGQPFVFNGSPGCPQCGSRTVADFVQTDRDAGVAGGPIRHHGYDALDETGRQALVTSTLDRLLDGA